MSTHRVERSNPSTDIEVAVTNKGDRLVAHARIVNNEGEDLNYTYHVLMNVSSGTEDEYSETIFLKDGSSYGLAVNLYPETESRANVRIRIHKGTAVEPLEDITFRFP